MSKFDRRIQAYQNNNNNNNSNKSFYNLGVKTSVNNKLQLAMTTQVLLPVLAEPIEQKKDDISKYHTGAKYGASKYTCSLQAGKMHKIIHNNS